MTSWDIIEIASRCANGTVPGGEAPHLVRDHVVGLHSETPRVELNPGALHEAPGGNRISPDDRGEEGRSPNRSGLDRSKELVASDPV